MQNNKKLFLNLFFILVGLTFLIDLIYGFTQIDDIKALNTGYYAQYAPGLYNLSVGVLVVELAMDILIILLISVGIYKVFSSAQIQYEGFNYGIEAMLVYAIGTNITQDMVVDYAGKYGVSAGSSIITMIVLTILMIVLFVASLFIDYFNNNVAKIACFILGMVLMFIAIIVSLCNSENSATIQIVLNIFMFFIIFASIPFALSYKANKPITVSASQDGVNADVQKAESAQQYQPANNNTNGDSAEQLRKLKSLLDEGIITKEEYDEKRKKYVDIL